MHMPAPFGRMSNEVLWRSRTLRIHCDTLPQSPLSATSMNTLRFRHSTIDDGVAIFSVSLMLRHKMLFAVKYRTASQEMKISNAAIATVISTNLRSVVDRHMIILCRISQWSATKMVRKRRNQVAISEVHVVLSLSGVCDAAITVHFHLMRMPRRSLAPVFTTRMHIQQNLQRRCYVHILWEQYPRHHLRCLMSLATAWRNR